MKKDKYFRINPKEAMKIWASKSKTFYVLDMIYNKVKTPVMVHGQWMLSTHDKRKTYVSNPNSEIGRKCEI